MNIKYNLSLRSINEDLCLKVNKFINTYQHKYNLLHNPPEILKQYIKADILEGKVTLTMSLQTNEVLSLKLTPCSLTLHNKALYDTTTNMHNHLLLEDVLAFQGDCLVIIAPCGESYSFCIGWNGDTLVYHAYRDVKLSSVSLANVNSQVLLLTNNLLVKDAGIPVKTSIASCPPLPLVPQPSWNNIFSNHTPSNHSPSHRSNRSNPFLENDLTTTSPNPVWTRPPTVPLPSRPTPSIINHGLTEEEMERLDNIVTESRLLKG